MKTFILTCFPDEEDCPKDVIQLHTKVGHVTKNRSGNFHVMAISMVISTLNVSVVGMKRNWPGS